MSTEQIPPIVAAVRAAIPRWMDSLNRGDSAGCGRIYTDDAVMRVKPFGTFTGRAEIEGFWKKMIDDGFKDATYLDPTQRVLAPDTVTQSSAWKMNKAHGVITNEVWKLQKDGSVLLVEDEFEVLSTDFSLMLNLPDRLRSAIESNGNKFGMYFNTKNAAGVGSCYTEDATMRARPYGNFSGRKEIEGFFQMCIDKGWSMLDYSNKKVRSLTGNTATRSGTFRFNTAHGVVTNEGWELQPDGEALLTLDEFEFYSQEEAGEIGAFFVDETAEQFRHPAIKYFKGINVRALPALLAFECAGLPYTEERIGFEEWSETKLDEILHPTATLPTLTVNGTRLNQSRSIAHLAGKASGLQPTNPLQSALVEEVVSCTEEISDGVRAANGDREKYLVSLKKWCTRIEKLTAGMPFFLPGDKPSMADFWILSLVSFLSSDFPNLKGIGKKSDFDNFHVIKGIIKATKEYPAVAHYFKNHPDEFVVDFE